MSEHGVTNKVSLEGKRAVAAVDFHHARIYAVNVRPARQPKTLLQRTLEP